MGFKRPLVQIQSLGPGKSSEIERFQSFFLSFGANLLSLKTPVKRAAITFSTVSNTHSGLKTDFFQLTNASVVLRELEQKAKHVAWDQDHRRTWFALFSMGGFTDELKQLAEERTDFLLVDDRE